MSTIEPESFRDKLSMISETGHRKKIYPADVSGTWRLRRDWTQAILILIFLLLPWTKMGGAQTVLLDLPNRKFALFGLIFHAHDGPLIFFVLGFLAVSLLLMTALWGRIWCGWACPQTVFLDAIYRRVETWLEGKHIQRRALDSGPWNFNKIWRKGGKWLAFFVISMLITHSFLAYFVGASEVIKMVQTNPNENMTPFIFILISTAIILFDFGWFREQFCIIACPYGRFQSVMLDQHSVTVSYDVKRGEPRKGAPEFAAAERKGDCISCSRCVQVCPTGIDIRNGQQLECVACTACIDACDEIMVKVNKPKGLIRYESLGERKPFYQRGRIIAYSIALTLFVSGLVVSIATRQDFRAQILRALETPFSIVQSPDGKDLVLNHLRLHLHSQIGKDLNIVLEMPPEEIAQGYEMRVPQTEWVLHTLAHQEIHLFVTMPKDQFKGGKQPFVLNVRDKDSQYVETVKAELLGPF